MDDFDYSDGALRAEGVTIAELAERFGTPLYVYSHAALTRQLRRLRVAIGDAPHLIAYSVKANPNLAVVRALANEGAGADVVSVGEMERALAAGVPADRIVFAGVGKRADELARGVEAGIRCFNVEVAEELELLAQVASERGAVARVAIRVNPDVEAETHEYIQTGRNVNKFGIPLAEARELYRHAQSLGGIDVRGVACHIGSQLLSLAPFAEALARLRELVLTLRAEDGIAIDHMDVGGGLGVRYHDETPPSIEDYVRTVREQIGDLGVELVFEPGRVIAANAGVLVTRVLYRKEIAGKHFVIVDQAMNDLQRPALYGAYHAVWPAREGTASVRADVVGPVCETGDFLARDRDVPDAAPGDLLVAMSAGAYGSSMASNYNTRARAAEVLVRGDEAHLVREREVVSDLYAGERIPDFLS